MAEDELAREIAFFRENQTLYQSIKNEIDNFSEVLGRKGIRHIWESRVKTPESLEGKLRKRRREGKSGIADMADLVGGRIVLLRLKDSDDVTKLIEKNFKLQQDSIQHPTVEEHSARLGGRFRGYDGHHFRLRLKQENKPEVIVEIQVVHIIMWLYYQVEHDLGYKGGQNPRALDRVLEMLKGAANLNTEAFEQFEEVFKDQQLKGGRIQVASPLLQDNSSNSESPAVASQIQILLDSENQELLRKLVQSHTTAAAQVNHIASIVPRLHDSLQKNERQALFNWLSKIQPKQNHKTMGKDFMAGLGEWLFDKTSFRDWRGGNKSSILWLHGIPGSGKSKLVYSVIQRLSNEDAHHPGAAPLAFFYCARNASEPERSDPNEIMRSLLKQLCCTKVDIPVREPLANKYKMLKNESNDDGVEEPPKLTCDECVDIIASIPNSATIVLDALDECDPDRRHELLLAFDKILQVSTSAVKIFVSSRDDGDIVYSLKSSPNIYIKTMDNCKDIERFVLSEVERYIVEKRLLGGHVTKDLQSRIIEILIKNSRGMFRWVSLQLQNLCDPRRMHHEKDVIEELGRLPKTLNASYDITYRIIEEAASTSARVAKLVFTWLLCAQRPLSTQEFITAVSVNVAAVDTAGLYIPLSPLQLLNMCCNMIVLDEEMNMFRFAHLSVQEYLEGRGGFDKITTNSVALELCLLVNLLELRTYPRSTTSLSNMEFKNYALITWPIHCQFVGDELERRLKERVIEFISSSYGAWRWATRMTCVTEYAKFLYEDMWWSTTTPLFLVFRFGLSWIVHEYEVFETWWNIENTAIRTPPLYLAARYGQEQIVKLLLGRRGVVNRKQMLAKSLSWALSERKSEVADLLFQEDINLDFKNTDGSTFLSMACARGDLETVDLLLQKGVDVNAKDRNGDTPLLIATSRGHLHIVTSLLQSKNIDVNAKDNEGNTSLLLASRREASWGVFALLLQQDSIDVNARNSECKTPLFLASSGMNLDKTTLLLQRNDVKVNTVDDLGHTPVYYIPVHSKTYNLLIAHGCWAKEEERNTLPEYLNRLANCNDPLGGEMNPARYHELN